MPKQPPLLPPETLRRVMRLARFDGTVVLMVSGILALGAASAHDVSDTVLGLGVAAGGAMELHGGGLLGRGEERGVNWLVSSQLLMLVLVIGYAIYRLTHLDVAMIRELFIASYSQDQLAIVKQIPVQWGMSNEQALRAMNSFCWGAVGVATLLYQGGMAIYYRRRRKAVVAALQES